MTDAPVLFVCTACRKAQGEAFLRALREPCRDLIPNVTLMRQECLWACSQGCTLMLIDTNRTGYLLGRFTQDLSSAAHAVAQFVAAHQESDDGDVPFARWPDAIKGHFIARIPARPIRHEQ